MGRNFVIVVFLLLLCNTLIAQNAIEGKIIDAERLAAIPYVNIYKFSEDGLPEKSILKEQLFTKSYKNETVVSLNVSATKLYIENALLVTIEPVRLLYDPSK